MPVFSAFAGNKLANMPKATAATARSHSPWPENGAFLFLLEGHDLSS
jgi:hypothetical protein